MGLPASERDPDLISEDTVSTDEKRDIKVEA